MLIARNVFLGGGHEAKMSKRRSLSLFVGVVASGALAFIHTGCGSTDNGSSFDQDSGAASDTGPAADTGPGFGGDGATGPYSDFPAAPVIDGAGDAGPAAPANAPLLFAGGSENDGGADAPCLVENEVGSLLPRNWLRPPSDGRRAVARICSSCACTPTIR